MRSNAQSLRLLAKKFKKQIFSRRTRKPVFEALERRELLYAAVQNLQLVNDTGTPGDLITSDPRVSGTVSGDFYSGSAKIEFDHGNDGVAEGNVTVGMVYGTFNYDPRITDPAFDDVPGPVALRYRALQYNSSQQLVYTGSWSTFNFTMAAPQPEISVLDSYAMSINDNTGSVNFMSTSVGMSSSQTFTVRNDGTATLTLDPQSLWVPQGYNVSSSFGSTSLAPNASTTFTVQLSGNFAGTWSGQIRFNNNDANENPFNFNVSGTVTSMWSPSLALNIAVQSIYETGGSTTATVSRSGTSGALTVNLSSNDTTEATVPATVVIPNGQTSASFTVTVVNDGITDGDRRVAITASSSGYESGGDYLDVLEDTTGNTPPVITAGQSFSVAENASSGAVVGTVAATDAQSNPLQSWTITSGNAAGIFAINANTGQLTIDNPANLNYESTTNYTLTLTVSDGIATSDPRTVTVNVTDFDEFDVGPISDTNAAANSVSEGSGASSTVGITVAATDADGTATVSYSLDNSAGGRFAINSSTGVVSRAMVLDAEMAVSHTITARATSSDGSYSTANFTIAVVDVDEFDTTAISDANAAANSVPENSAIGTAVGVTAFADDADATETISYTLDNTAGGRFSIHSTTGVITTAAELNYEAATSHVITVRATSTDTSFTTANFTIAVSNVNESVGAISDSDANANSVAENVALGTAVGVTALATDPDAGQTVSYSLDNNAGGKFTIHSTTGVVSTAAALDAESSTSHSITVRATSSDGSFSTAAFTIQVSDFDEFDIGAASDSNSASNSVNENSSLGTSVGVAILADDADINDTVSYSLDNSAGGKFTIHASTGVVTTAASLDFEAAISHPIVARATSTDGSYSTVNVTIAVVNVNESVGSVSDSNGASNSVSEAASVGTLVGVTAVAVDPDAGSTITYTLDNNAGGRFVIHSSTGVVTVNASLDAEVATSHTITVRAESSDCTFTTANFTIAVDDVDEFDIGALSDSDVAANSVDANRPVGTAVGITARAVDADATATITYSLDNNAGGRFTIDANSGVVRTAAVLDVLPASHTITARATSSDGSTVTSSYTIAVVDTDDPPVITAGQTFSVWESAIVGTIVGKILATDDNNILQDWTITSGNDDGIFAINPHTGKLSIANNSNLNYSWKTSHTLTVSVSDGIEPTTQTINVNVLDVNNPINVTSTGDTSNSGDGVTTLREAIQQANSTAGKDVILLPSGMGGDIVLTQSSGIVVDSEIQIVGRTDGAILRITLQPWSTPAIRIFDVASGSKFYLSDVFLHGGNLTSGSGGAISNAGDSILTRVTIANSSATSGNGGAIFNAASGNLELINGTLSTNSAGGSGGGAYNAGVMTLDSVTVTDNSAASAGRGVVSANGATTIVRNTIIAGNQTNTDVSGAFQSLGHNLIGNSSGATGFNAAGDLAGTTGALINAILGVLQDNGGSAPTHQLLVGSPAIDAGDNLEATSTDQRGAPRVLDGPDPSDATDAISTIDIGAFEFGTFFADSNWSGMSYVDALDVTPLADGRVDHDPYASGDQISIRAAVQELNALAGWRFNSSNPGSVMEGVILMSVGHCIGLQGANENYAATGDLDVFGNLTVRGIGPSASSISGGGCGDPAYVIGSKLKDRIFHVLPGSKLKVENVSLTEGHSIVTASSDAGYGGGILNDGGTLTVIRSSFGGDNLIQPNNDADLLGGGIYTRNGNVTIADSFFAGNGAVAGGGLYIESGQVTITASEFQHNNATDFGAGIYLQSGDLFIGQGSEFRLNMLVDPNGTVSSAGNGAGGALYVAPTGRVHIEGATRFTQNTYLSSGEILGSAIYNAGEMTIEGESVIASNGSFPNGVVSALYNTGNLTIRDSHIDYNSGGVVGGIYNTSTGVIDVTGGTVSNNLSDQDKAGAIHNDGGKLTMRGTVLNGNILDKHGAGGAIHNDNGIVTLTDVTLSGNGGFTTGGAIYNYDLDAELTIVNSSITNNVANMSGAGIFNQYGSVTIRNSTIANNGTHIDNVGGAGIYNRGENRLITTSTTSLVELAAAVNLEQNILYVNDVTPMLAISLPTGILVGDEHMVVTEVDEFRQALIVERTAGQTHSVSTEVKLFIDESQTQITLGNPADLTRYRLPLDILITKENEEGDVIGTEMMTVTAMNGNVATVERGRQGTKPLEHVYPLEIWGVGGALTISGSTVSHNRTQNQSLSEGGVAGGGLRNYLHPFVRPTIIENSTFSGNEAHFGSNIWTAVGLDTQLQTVGHISQSHFERLAPAWDTSDTESLFIQNSVIAGGLDTPGIFNPDVSGFVHSGGNNLVGIDYVSTFTLGDELPANETSLPLVIGDEQLPPVPFTVRISHLLPAPTPGELVAVHEEMLITSVTTDSGVTTLNGLRGQGSTEAVLHPSDATVTISLSGFWAPGDKHGSQSGLEDNFSAELNEPTGITATTTLFHVSDSSGFPEAPFMLRIHHTEDKKLIYEDVLVTHAAGNALTVARGQQGTRAASHPDHSVVTYRHSLSTRLDPRLGPLRDAAGPTQVHLPEPGSPLLDTGGKQGFQGQFVIAATGLGESQHVRLPVYMAVDPVTINTELKAFAFADDEVLSIADIAALPAAPFIARIGDELLQVNAVQFANGTITVERGAFGTTATQHGFGTPIVHGYPITANSTLTTFNVRDTADLPPTPFAARFGAELLKVIAINTTSNTITVERGAYSSIPEAHAVGTMLSDGYDVNREITLAADSNATQLHVSDAMRLPQVPFLMRINGERIRVTAVDVPNNTLTVQRGVHGTTPLPIVSGARTDHGTLLELDSLGEVAIGTEVRIGNEQMLIVSIDNVNKLVAVDRAIDRTQIGDHFNRATILYGNDHRSEGFHGNYSLLAQPVASSASNQIIVSKPLITLPSTFDIQTRSEVMKVTSFVDNSDGTLTLNVIRGVSGTTAGNDYVVGSHVQFLVDQRGSQRYVDGNSDQQAVIDIGAAEGIIFQVNTTLDTPDLTPGNGNVNTATVNEISLRAAVMEANALKGLATILLPAGTYNLSASLPVAGSIQILGDGATTTSVVASSTRLFEVTDGGFLRVVGTTLANGDTNADGGAVLVDQGELVVESSVLADNDAFRGGAIATYSGRVTLINSTLSGNQSSQDGGAIFNLNGSVAVTNTTVSTNVAGGSGGAIFSSEGATLTLSSSTVANNTASVSGGIHSNGPTTFGNSIVALNTATSGEADVDAHATSRGSNLIGIRQQATSLTGSMSYSTTSVTVADTSILPTVPFVILVGAEQMRVTEIIGNALMLQRAQNGTTAVSHTTGEAVRFDGFWAAGDLFGSSGTPLNPVLGPLQLNSGSIPTHALLTGSPAIDAGELNVFDGFTSSLGATISGADHEIFVTEWESLPQAPFSIRVENELMRVVAVNRHALTVVRNGAIGHSRGSKVSVIVDGRGMSRPAMQDTGPPVETTPPWNSGPPSDIDIGTFELVPLVSLAAINATKVEDNSGTNSFTFRISRTGKTTGKIWVNYRVARSTGFSVDPYDFVNNEMPVGTAVFEAGDTQKDITVHVDPDTIVEHDEGFVLVLTDASPEVVIAVNRANAMILNDDTATLSITDVSAVEGRPLVFTIALDHGVQDGFQVPWSTTDGTAQVSNADYTSDSDLISFKGLEGESHTVVVRTGHDDIVERNETLNIVLSALQKLHPLLAANLNVDASGIGTLTNDDTTTLVVRGIRRVEGDSGQTSFVATVTLTPNAVDTAFTVTAATSNGTATSASDFVAISSTLSFSGAAEQNVSFSVPVNGDVASEANESFSISLSNLQAPGREAFVTLGSDSSFILNDDGPAVIVRDVSAVESNSGNTVLTFDVVLNNPLGPVSVTVSTSNGTALADAGATINDYVAKTQTLNFTGVDNEVLQFTVETHGDSLVELDEAFNVVLSNLQAGGNESQYTLVAGVGKLLNDDYATIVITHDNPCGDAEFLVCADENSGSLTYRVTLVGSVDVPLSVTIGTIQETLAANEFSSSTQTLQFNGTDGQTLNYTVNLVNDTTLGEGTETFSVAFSNLQAEGRNVRLGPTAASSVRDEDVIIPPQYEEKEDECGQPVVPTANDVLRPIEKYMRPLFTYFTWDIDYFVSTDPNRVNNPNIPDGVWYLYGFVDEHAQVYSAMGWNLFVPDWNASGVFPSNFVYHVPTGTNWGNTGFRVAGAGDLPNLDSLRREWPDLPPPDSNSSDPNASANEECEEEEEEEEDPENPPPVVPIKAEWVVPHTGSLTFNPFSTFNYRLSSDIGLTVGIAGQFVRIGESLPLTFGTVTVNKDMTITYVPFNDLMQSGKLKPEVDANGVVHRYTAFEDFEAHLVDNGVIQPNGTEGESMALPIAYASLPVKLAVSNHLPTIRGSRIHAPASGAFQLDSALYVDLETTLRVDLRDLFVDMDGEADLSKLVIKDIKYGTEKLNMSNDQVTPKVVDRYPNQIRVPIAGTTSGETVTDPATGNQIVQFGGAPTEYSIIVTPAGSAAIDVHNTIRPGLIATLNNVSYPSLLTFRVIVTDGTKKPKLDSNGAPVLVNGQPVLEDVTWELVLDVKPNPDDPYTSSVDWQRETAAPEVDFRPWLKTIVPTIDRLVPDPPPTPRESIPWRVSGTSRTSLDSYNSEPIGDADVDVFSGAIRLHHDLILDGSGGASEMSLPGLVYDSSTVYEGANSAPIVHAVVSNLGGQTPDSIIATLKWYDNDGTFQSASRTLTAPGANAEYLIGLKAPNPPQKTGVYGWQIETTIKVNGQPDVVVTTNGETPVVVINNQTQFGGGWRLRGVPIIWVDKNREDDYTATNRSFDDRLILDFPGQAPRIFNARSLTINNYNYGGQLPSLQPGSTEISNPGFANPQEFGTLTSKQYPSELVYKTGDGTEYVFKPFDALNGEKIYLVIRIEQPGIELSDFSNTGGRRGISFEYNSATPPAMTGIVAADGKRTSVNGSQFSLDSGTRVVNLTLTGGYLTEIRHQDSVSGDRIRRFTYDAGRVNLDQWFDAQNNLVRHSDYDYDPTIGRLSQVQLGDGIGANEQMLVYTVAPAASVAFSGSNKTRADLIGSYSIVASDLQRYNESNGTTSSSAGTYKTQLNYSMNGLMQAREELFNDQSLAREEVGYDHIGFVKHHKDPVGRYTFYWHDYETPVAYAYNQNDPNDNNADTLPKYDFNDYRGNVTYLVTPGGQTVFQYETDDEVQAALGTLVKEIDKPKLNAGGLPAAGGTISKIVTEYERNLDGRLKSQKIVRSAPTANAPDPDDYFESWVYDGTKKYLKQHTDARGLVTDFVVDAAGRVTMTTVTDSFNNQVTTTTVAYDARGNVDTEVVQVGGMTVSTTDYDYGPVGQLNKQRVDDGNGTTLRSDEFQYAPDGTLVLTRNGRGVESRSTHDKAGLLKKVENAKAATYPNQFLGNNAHLIEQVTSYEYYADGSLKKEILPDLTERRHYTAPVFQPDPTATPPRYVAAQWIQITGVAGASTASGIVTNQTLTTRTDRDQAGRVVNEKDLLRGGETRYVYADARNDLPTTTTAQFVERLGSDNLTTGKATVTIEQRYDAFGNLVYEKNGDTAARSTWYDELGNVRSQIVHALYGAQLSYQTTPTGEVLTLKERRRDGTNDTTYTTKFVYDEQGRLRETIDQITDGIDPCPASGVQLNNNPDSDECGVGTAKTSYSADAGWLKIESRSREGYTTASWVDAAGQTRKVSNQYGGEVQYTYDLAGNLIRATTPAYTGIPATDVEYKYDGLNRRRSVVQHGAHSITSYVDYMRPQETTAGWDMAVTDAAGKVTATISDSIGNTIVTVQPSGVLSDSPSHTSPLTLLAYEYNPAEKYERITSLLTVGDAATPTGALMIDGSYAERRVSRIYRDNAGHTLMTEDQLGFGSTTSFVNQTKYSYDGNGRLVDNKDANGNVTYTLYDDDKSGTGQPRAVMRPTAEGVYTQYDSAGHKTRQSDNQSFNGLSRLAWSYDALGRLTYESIRIDDTSTPVAGDWISAFRFWEYAGKSTTYMNRNSQSIVTTVNPSNRTRTEQTTDSVGNVFTTTYEFFPTGQMKSATEKVEKPGHYVRTDSSVSFQYDDLGRQINETQNASFFGDAAPQVTLATQWFDTGPIQRIDRKLGANADLVSQVTYQVDNLGRIISAVENLASNQSAWWLGASVGEDKIATFTYLADGNVGTISRYKSTASTGPQRGHSVFQYRADGRNQSIAHVRTVGGNDPIANYSLQYNTLGLLEWQTTTMRRGTADGYTTFVQEQAHLEYDARHQLKTVTVDDTTTTSDDPGVVTNYVIDAHGNPTNSVAGFDNRIYSEPATGGGTRTFKYDQEGRVIEKREVFVIAGEYSADSTVEVTTYTWDHKGRLLSAHYSYVNDVNGSVISDSAKRVNFYYDALGRPIGRAITTYDAPGGAITSNSTYFHLYDTTGRVMEIDMTNGSPKIVRHYFNNQAAGGLLAADQAAAAGPTTTVWAFSDQTNSATTVARVNGSGGWEVYLRTFDAFGNVKRAGGDTTAALQQVPVVWNGLLYDSYAELYIVGSTGVDPTSGRYISQAAADSNPYRFASNDPISRIPRAKAPIKDPTWAEVLTSREFAEGFSRAVNPANQWQDGNKVEAVIQTVGWIAFVIGTAGAGFLGTASVVSGAAAASGFAASGAIGYGVAGTATAMALAGGATSTYLNNPNAGIHEYAFGMGLNAINPIGGAIGLAAGGVGYGIDRAAGGTGRTGFLIGDLAGNLAGMGVEDVVRVVAKGGSFGKAAAHAAKQVGITGAIAGGTAAGVYGATGDLDSALFWGNIAATPGNMVARGFVACFVAGTPVFIPVDVVTTSVAAGILLPAPDLETPEATWQHYVGTSLLLIGAAGWMWVHAQQKREERYQESIATEAVFSDEEFSDWLGDLLRPIEPLWETKKQFLHRAGFEPSVHW